MSNLIQSRHTLLLATVLALCLLPPVHADADGQTVQQRLPREPAVATANAYATDAAIEVLSAGGNAFDAAIAASAMLGLVEPESSGLGGGGFFLLHRASDGVDVFVDARETAPAAATRDMYLDADGQPDRDRAINGPLAAGIPGLPAALVHLAENYGELALAQSLAPAIRQARHGWRFGRKNHDMLAWRRDVVAAYPGSRQLFLIDGERPAIGTLMRNPDYARTLERLARDGHDGFYGGETARTLVEGVRAAGGIWSLEDLSGYALIEREPIRVAHRGYRVVTAPPPSSGGVALAQLLQIIAGYDYAALPRLQRVHLLVESMRRAYRDRAIYLGDPDFVDVPVSLLTSADYAAGLRAGIHPQRATPSALLPGVDTSDGSEDTTHFSIIDTRGNLVAATLTVNLPYGNGFVVEGTGFVLNNEMDDFSVKPGVPNAFGLVGDDANAIEPGKRPLSSMTPSFLMGPDRVAVIGTPGGSRIITMVALGLVELMQGASADAVVAMPRFHHQYLPDRLSLEPDAFSTEEIEGLQAMGHEIDPRERGWGNMQLVIWNLANGEVQAGSDPRWEGVGAGSTGERVDAEAVFR
jgi:gamma-glutamyltranspeptidase / glutathione hydrolase